MEQIFSDGIGSISIIGGTVRIDFMAFSPTEKDHANHPKAVHQQRVVMTLEAFAQSAEKMKAALQGLEKFGPRTPVRQTEAVSGASTNDVTAPKRPFP